MTTDFSSQQPAARPSMVSHRNLPRFGDSSQSSELVADLDDHRIRRVSSDPETAEFRDDSAPSVTVLVISVAGAADQSWLRELVETHLLSVDEFSIPPKCSDASKASVRPQTVPRTDPSSRLTVNQLHMDLDEMRVTLAEQPILLTRQEFLLLRVFMQHPSRLLTRQQLLEQAWGEADWIRSRTIDVHVRRVRGKLGSRAPQIVTVRGFGYRFEPGEAEPAATGEHGLGSARTPVA